MPNRKPEKLQTFACYHLVDLQKLSISCTGHFDFPHSVYNLWCFYSFSNLLILPLVDPFINLKVGVWSKFCDLTSNFHFLHLYLIRKENY